MAKAEQIKALLKSHIDRDDTRFYSIMMQVAAAEARNGHIRLAEELKKIIDQAKLHSTSESANVPIPISTPRGELTGLLAVEFPKIRLSDMVLPQGTLKRLQRVLKEHRFIGELKSHGLDPRRKLLLIGPPGCGKTMTASVLAGELGIPLFIVRLDGLITKFMGETASKLKLIFDSLSQARGVYLFDEFDAIGSQRGFINDVGEIRRVLNSFLMFIERDVSHSLIIAATNHPQSLDHALFRRFNDIIEFEPPSKKLIQRLISGRSASAYFKTLDLKQIADTAYGLSYADTVAICDEVMKNMIIERKAAVSTEDFLRMIAEKKNYQTKS